MQTSSITFPERSRDDYRANLEAMVYVGFMIPCNPRLSLSPRLSYTYPITKPLADDAVKLTAIQGALGLEWSL